MNEKSVLKALTSTLILAVVRDSRCMLKRHSRIRESLAEPSPSQKNGGRSL
jgi:hypothetical protein